MLLREFFFMVTSLYLIHILRVQVVLYIIEANVFIHACNFSLINVVNLYRKQLLCCAEDIPKLLPSAGDAIPADFCPACGLTRTQSVRGCESTSLWSTKCNLLGQVSLSM